MKKPKPICKSARKLLECMEEERVICFKIECHGCGKEDEITIDNDTPPTMTVHTLEDAAQAFYVEGWREGQSETWQMIGIMCPRCWRNRNKPEDQHE